MSFNNNLTFINKKMYFKLSLCLISFMLAALPLYTSAKWEAPALPSKTSLVKTMAFSWAIAHAASSLSKKCALWESYEFFGLDRNGLMYTAVMLDLKHVNNAIARMLFAESLSTPGQDDSYIQSIIKSVLFISKKEGAESAIVPALYKEFNGQELTYTDKLSLEWYNAATGFLTFWECGELLMDAFNEWKKKWGLGEQENSSLDALASNEHSLVHKPSVSCPSKEQNTNLFARILTSVKPYTHAAWQDLDVHAWGISLFATSYIGNIIGQYLGQSATNLFAKNDMGIFRREGSVLLKYAPFFKFSDTVISYFIAQYIKHHVFAATRATQDYFGGYKKENAHYWNLLYRAADKGPFAYYCIINTIKAWRMYKDPKLATNT